MMTQNNFQRFVYLTFEKLHIDKVNSFIYLHFITIHIFHINSNENANKTRMRIKLRKVKKNYKILSIFFRINMVIYISFFLIRNLCTKKTQSLKGRVTEIPSF